MLSQLDRLRWSAWARWLIAAGALALVACSFSGLGPHATAGVQTISVGNGPDALAVAPDGRVLYVANWGRGGFCRNNGHIVTLVNLATGKPGKRISVGNEPSELAISPDGRILLVALNSGNITVVNTTTGSADGQIQVRGGVTAMEFSPDGRTLYAGGRDLLAPVLRGDQEQGNGNVGLPCISSTGTPCSGTSAKITLTLHSAAAAALGAG